MHDFWTKLGALLLPGLVLALLVGGIIAISISVVRGADRMPEHAPNEIAIQMAFIEGFRWGSFSGMLSVGEEYLPAKTIHDVARAQKMRKEANGTWLPIKVPHEYQRVMDLLRGEK